MIPPSALAHAAAAGAPPEPRDERDGEAAAEPLSTRTADRLRDLIVTEELAAGTRLRERTLAARLGVSRTPLRDALKLLAADGLVTLSPNRGAVVSPFSATAVAEKLDVLAALEGFAGERAAASATDAEIAEIRALHHEMLAAFERRDRSAYFHLNQAIHHALVAAARNPTLASLHGQLNRQLYAYRWRGSADLALWSTAVAEHGRLVELLNARNAAGLSAALRAHVGSTWRQIREEDADPVADRAPCPEPAPNRPERQKPVSDD